MFKIKTSGKLKASNSPVDQMAIVIAGSIKRIQVLFAQCMQLFFQKIGTRSSKFVFVIILTVSGLYSVYITATALFQPKQGTQLFRQTSIQLPENIQRNKSNMLPMGTDTNTSIRLRAFLIYFDSIRLTQPIQYDSILQSRPGLIDSIRMLHQIYSSQQKK